ncbi:MAG TPA: SDR family oxidoreductase [Kofleriaceae bacterium]|nr:SDR family oxidoreductase [Kofleriaceae bacterium]
MFSLDGKVCVITGALGLLGHELTRAFAEAGARVVITDLDHGACVGRAHVLGATALGHGADITRPESLAALLAAILDRFARLDVLVNNAAIDDRFDPGAAADESRFERYSLARWQRMLDANVTGMFLSCQTLGGAIAERCSPVASGSIINISSIYGVVAPDQALYRRPDGTQAFYKSPAYPTAKAAVLGFTRYLAAYWGPSGVRVNAISPGGIHNGQDTYFVEAYARRTALGRMAAPRDYAGAAVFLASDASAYMTGANLVVDGGFTAW